jgi:hypothetical protein
MKPNRFNTYQELFFMINSKEKFGIRLVTLMAFIFLSIPSHAHVIVTELEKMSGTDAAWLYLGLGYKHILPLGFDHILFVLSLFLLSPGLKSILWQSTAFTVAHSVTLGLAMYHVITPSPRIIEPLISLSIMYVGLENIFSPKLKASRIGVVFLFGLVHGLGFAGALGEMGLPSHAYFTSLIMFNLGVEFGQMTIILLAFYLLGKWWGPKPFYRKAVVIPLSLLIVMVAGYWTMQRIF